MSKTVRQTSHQYMYDAPAISRKRPKLTDTHSRQNMYDMPAISRLIYPVNFIHNGILFLSGTFKD